MLIVAVAYHNKIMRTLFYCLVENGNLQQRARAGMRKNQAVGVGGRAPGAC